LTATAQAEWEWKPPFALDDPLARRIVCTGTLESHTLGPYGATISIFSVPEPDGHSERLFVGLVENIFNRRAPSNLWRGPVAARWQKLGPAPGYRHSMCGPNPTRYRVERLAVQPDGRIQTDILEIDLSAKPALLRRVGGGPGQPQYMETQTLGESLTMNDSLRLIVRLDKQRIFRSSVLTLRSYEMSQGEDPPPAECPVVLKTWEGPLDSHLLAVNSADAPSQQQVFFLPMRAFGWTLEKLLTAPVENSQESFVLQMLAQYLVPLDNGELSECASRHRVSVGLRGLSITTMERGLEYNSRNESWERPKTKR
jgi:hypothetical protein